MGGGEDGTGGAFSGVGTTPPTNYGSILNSPTTSDVVGGTQALLSFRQLNAASEDVGPGGSVDVSNARNAAAVIAVRPVAAAPPALVLEQGYVNFNDPGVYMQADEPRGIRRAWHPRRSGIFVPEYAI